MLLGLQALEKLDAFLHDDDVGGEIGVEHDVDADLAAGGDDMALHIGAGRHAKLLAEGDTHRRRELDDRGDFRVVDVVERLVDLVAFAERPGRADEHALAAGDAGRIGLVAAALQFDQPIDAGLGHHQGVDLLEVAADGDAALAAHAAGHVADDRRRGIVDRPRRGAGAVEEAVLLEPDELGEVLQFAVAVADAGGAVL